LPWTSAAIIPPTVTSFVPGTPRREKSPRKKLGNDIREQNTGFDGQLTAVFIEITKPIDFAQTKTGFDANRSVAISAAIATPNNAGQVFL
jgi:hypothetical protein